MFVCRQGRCWTVALCGTFCLWSSTCAPKTDLWNQAVDARDQETSALALASPGPGEADVPVNLHSLVLRVPPSFGSELGAPTPVSLRGGGADVPTRSAGVAPCEVSPSPRCWWLDVDGTLAAGTNYQATLETPLSLDDGRTVPAGAFGAFTTATLPDDEPPVLVVRGVDLAGPCLHVTLTVSEPAALAVIVEGAAAGTPSLRWPAGQGTADAESWVPFASMGLRGPASLFVEGHDRSGNVGASAATPVTLPDLPPLAITEILSNPAGPEPAQEFVEIVNTGAGDVDLAGLWLEDGKGRDVLPSAILPAQAFALIVASGFDGAAPGDVPPKPGTLIVRVDSRLGGDGLSNDRDVVRLALPGGTVITSYDGSTSTAAAAWNGRSLHRRAGSTCDTPSSWSSVPALPTPGWE
jgi:hypothetical protein